MDISPSQIETGDFILIGRSDITVSPITGFTIRPMTSGELAGQATVPETATGGWWLSASEGYAFGPGEVFLILAVVKSHKVASDDLGPIFGLADA